MGKSYKLTYEITDIRFVKDPHTRMSHVWMFGQILSKNTTNHFSMQLRPRRDGNWDYVGIIWKEQPNYLVNRDLIQKLVNAAARLLDTINMWSEKQLEKGAQLAFNERMPPKEVTDRVIFSFRPGMLDLPSPDWASMWDRIKYRVEDDPYFKVQGFNHKDIKTAINILCQIFPASWVSAKYRKTGVQGMGDEFLQGEDSWFPAYHLARTAQGAICIDPGWNYLIEIGLSVRDLKKFDGLNQLKQQVSRNPGTQHHLCLAAELYRKKFLIGLEPKTGSGSTTNDLLVAVEGRKYAIEVKEFSSGKPLKRLEKEVERKIKNLPIIPRCPVIFHVVLSQNSTSLEDHTREEKFFNELEQMSRTLPPQISAVIAGTRFIDSSGGRVKHRTEKTILNSQAKLPSNHDDLVTLFPTNYEFIQYPIFGIGRGKDSLFHFSKG